MEICKYALYHPQHAAGILHLRSDASYQLRNLSSTRDMSDNRMRRVETAWGTPMRQETLAEEGFEKHRKKTGPVVQVSTAATTRSETSHQGTGRSPYSLRLQTYPRPVAPRGLADQSQACASAVLRTRPAITVPAPPSPRQCCTPPTAEAARQAPERGVEHGLYGRPTG